LATLGLLASGCGKGQNGGASCASPVTTIHPNTSSAPTLTFYYGATTDATGTALANGNWNTFATTHLKDGGAGPFGVWETGSGGEVAAEIEMRLKNRLGVFAMADGVVAYIQTSTAPLEAGEVEGVWVRYGSNYVIKYVHVLDPIVSAGDQITAGQRLGSMVGFNSGGMVYFWEAELQRKSGSTISSLWWSPLLSNVTAFNNLFTVPYVSASGWTTDGSTPTTVSSWKSDANTAGEIDSTDRSQPCAFN